MSLSTLNPEYFVKLIAKISAVTEIKHSKWNGTHSEQPECYTNLMKYFYFAECWSKEHFVKEYGNKQIISHDILLNREESIYLSDYLSNKLLDSSDAKMCHWQCTPENGNSLSELSLPQIFTSWFYNNSVVKNPFWRWIIFGPSGGGTLIHSDIADTSAWNYLVRGYKIWIFFEPGTHLVKNIFESGKIFLDSIQSGGRVSYCLQKEGNFVWVPPRWVHQVLYLRPSISISENIINETNIEIVKKYYRKECPERYKLLILIENSLKDFKNV